MIKNRLFTGWNIWRIIYLVIGIAMLIQAAVYEQWLGVILGIYMSSMGLFGFGCAGGSCSNGSCDIKGNQTNK